MAAPRRARADAAFEYSGRVVAYLVHQLLADSAARTPDALALVIHDPGAARLTYAEVAAAAARVASQLVALGVAAATASRSSPTTASSGSRRGYGALAAGAIAVPINTAADPLSLVHYVQRRRRARADRRAAARAGGGRRPRALRRARRYTVLCAPAAVGTLAKALPAAIVTALPRPPASRDGRRSR